MSPQDDKLWRAFARLQSLRANLPETHYLDEIYVDQYHEALKHLEDLNFDIVEFKVPAGLLERIAVAGNASTGEVEYSGHRTVQRAILLSKLDAVLSYFEMATPAPLPRKMGFHLRLGDDEN